MWNAPFVKLSKHFFSSPDQPLSWHLDLSLMLQTMRVAGDLMGVYLSFFTWLCRLPMRKLMPPERRSRASANSEYADIGRLEPGSSTAGSRDTSM